jgi:hypothetical protein
MLLTRHTLRLSGTGLIFVSEEGGKMTLLIDRPTRCHLCGGKMEIGERFEFADIRSHGINLHRPVHPFHLITNDQREQLRILIERANENEEAIE